MHMQNMQKPPRYPRFFPEQRGGLIYGFILEYSFCWAVQLNRKYAYPAAQAMFAMPHSAPPSEVK